MQEFWQHDTLISTIQHLYHLLQQSGDWFHGEISAKQWYVLCHIARFEDQPPTLNQLAAQMGSSHQNVKQIVIKLEGKGYVRIYTDQEDRRKRRIALMARYQTLLERYAGQQERFLQVGFQGIDPSEEEQTLNTLRKLEANIQQFRSTPFDP